MSKVPTSTISPQPHYDEACKYLSQAEGLNLALWTSSDVHEQIKPACWLMAELLSHITTEINGMQEENKRGQ